MWPFQGVLFLESKVVYHIFRYLIISDNVAILFLLKRFQSIFVVFFMLLLGFYKKSESFAIIVAVYRIWQLIIFKFRLRRLKIEFCFDILAYALYIIPAVSSNNNFNDFQ